MIRLGSSEHLESHKTNRNDFLFKRQTASEIILEKDSTTAKEFQKAENENQ